MIVPDVSARHSVYDLAQQINVYVHILVCVCVCVCVCVKNKEHPDFGGELLIRYVSGRQGKDLKNSTELGFR